jgi:hypothetical protein
LNTSARKSDGSTLSVTGDSCIGDGDAVSSDGCICLADGAFLVALISVLSRLDRCLLYLTIGDHMFARHPDYHAKTGIGIPPDRTYKITRFADEAITACVIPAAGERLLHVLMHEACKAKDRRVPARGEPLVGQLRLSCKLIRDRLGLAGSNDNRAIQRGLEELQAAGHFVDAEFLHDGLLFQWSFTDEFEQRLFLDHSFGLFDIDDVRHLHSPLRLWLHRKLGLVWRMHRPFLEFSVVDLLMETGGYQPPAWTGVSRQLADALHEIAKRENARFLVFGWWKGDLPGIDHVTIRIEHSQTEWQKKALVKMPSSTKKIHLVEPTGRRILTSIEGVTQIAPFSPIDSQTTSSIAA